MKKLKKLEEEYYIVVDDYEILRGNYFLQITYEGVFQALKVDDKYIYFGDDNYEPIEFCKKITHSTQPLEDIGLNTSMGTQLGFAYIEPLLLSEVEEVICEYSVEKMAEDYIERNFGKSNMGAYVKDGFIEGFKAHQELVKDKLFTANDMINAFIQGTNAGALSESLVDYDSSDNEEAREFSESEFEDFKASLLPKTEWEVEFDQYGKIKILNT